MSIEHGRSAREEVATVLAALSRRKRCGRIAPALCIACMAAFLALVGVRAHALSVAWPNPGRVECKAGETFSMPGEAGLHVTVEGVEALSCEQVKKIAPQAARSLDVDGAIYYRVSYTVENDADQAASINELFSSALVMDGWYANSPLLSVTLEASPTTDFSTLAAHATGYYELIYSYSKDAMPPHLLDTMASQPLSWQVCTWPQVVAVDLG